mgnify:CR=1 FL=1
MTATLQNFINTTFQDDLLRRAVSAWFKHGKGYPLHEQPSASLSTVEEADGHTYIILRNVNGIITVYRFKNNGVLKRLVRIPKAFRSESAEA